MLKHWRTLGYGAILGGVVGTVGCTSLRLPGIHSHSQGCGSCSAPAGTCDTCGPGCGPGYASGCGPGGAGDCQQCGGIRGRVHAFFHRRSNAVPDTFPLGKVSEAWYYEMETNAEAVDFVIHDLDFVGQTTELTSDGKDHVMEIAARMRAQPFPVIVERFPNNADPELDVARRNLIAQILTDFGNPDAQQRVVVAPSYTPGYTSRQAQATYWRHTLTNGNGNNGNFGNNFGGTGSFGGGSGF
ncbi:hypothetical protein Pan44_34480 [Caulifigura coniformis]|uniref:Uncharacterized protein n=1 Tax=Caulifigura coniformis TaxID=2527983 RepID=A0A517SGZ9_9PLAN|nr:hypothetical protein [Caulifigura coniformis]QDT55405.1 hypothetical protein Pan44_34480 [Caulifigura coniformis]